MIRFRGYVRLWKSLLSFGVPLALLPLALHADVKMRCAYVLCNMTLFWLLGLAPDSVTALMPIALFPLLGVLSTTATCTQYMKPAVMMMISGLILAFAIQECNLHKRIALKLLLIVGTGVKKVLLGLMIGTMILSFWISNTATTAMMLPITDAIVTELSARFNSSGSKRKKRSKRNLRDEHGFSDPERRSVEKVNMFKNVNLVTVTTNKDKVTTISIQDAHNREAVIEMHKEPKEVKSLKLAFFLSIAYASNIGGTGTLTGTGPNLVLQGIMDEFYPETNELAFSSWVIYAAPGAILLVILSWTFMQFYFLRKLESNDKQSKFLQIYLEKRYRSLGSFTFHESAVIFFFVSILLLWFFRSPKFMPGWENYINSGTKINDATPAFFVLIIMFLIPADFKQFTDYKPEQKKPIKYLINWRSICKKIPWGVILLVGGGFSLAEGTSSSGLSNWFGEQLKKLDIKSPKILMITFTIFAALITEITSNAATAAVILPVINQAALTIKVHPLYFMLPVTVSVSFAFMLPVATPCNALVYEYLKMKVTEMLFPGLIMNIICVTVELIMISTWGKFLFQFDTFPDWALKKSLELNITKY